MTLRQLMGHVAGVRNDGGDEGPLFSTHCERPVEALQAFAERPLLFEPGTRYRYSSYGWILVSAAVEAAADEPFLTFMRKQIFEPLGMDDTRADSRDGGDPGSGDVLFPEVRGGSPLRPGPDARRSTIPATREPASSCPRRPTWCASHGDQQRQAAAARHRPTAPDVTATALGSRRRVTVLAGTSRPLRWRANRRAWSATTANILGGTVASFMTFPDGIVVAVTSNISYADTVRGRGENRGGVREAGGESSAEMKRATCCGCNGARCSTCCVLTSLVPRAAPYVPDNGTFTSTSRYMQHAARARGRSTYARIHLAPLAPVARSTFFSRLRS